MAPGPVTQGSRTAARRPQQQRCGEQHSPRHAQLLQQLQWWQLRTTKLNNSAALRPYARIPNVPAACGIWIPLLPAAPRPWESLGGAAPSQGTQLLLLIPVSYAWAAFTRQARLLWCVASRWPLPVPGNLVACRAQKHGVKPRSSCFCKALGMRRQADIVCELRVCEVCPRLLAALLRPARRAWPGDLPSRGRCDPNGPSAQYMTCTLPFHICLE